jgi:hypothetical protein
MTDIYEDIRIVVQRHREQAAAEERAKIVAWLRSAPYSVYEDEKLKQIEAKEHLK